MFIAEHLYNGSSSMKSAAAIMAGLYFLKYNNDIQPRCLPGKLF